MKKTEPAPGDFSCLPGQSGWVFYSGYGGCRPPLCPNGRDADGYCVSPVIVVPSKPKGVEADGDSRGLAGNIGRAVVEWQASSRAAGYEIQYKNPDLVVENCETPGCADWRNGPSVTGLSVILPNLEIEDLYHIRVKAVHSSGGESRWSEIVYVYPTRVPAASGDTVGELNINGYISPATYTYRICPHTLTGMSASDQSAWIAEVVEGISLWADATGEVDSEHDTELICSSDPSKPSSEIQSSTNLAINTVEQVNTQTLTRRRCVSTIPGYRVAGCAESLLKGGKIIRTRINILHGQGNTIRYARGSTVSRRCTKLNQVAMHEAGHAFGLEHSTKEDSISVMNFKGHSTCYPEKYDIVAIKAIYQSRPDSNSETTTTTTPTTTTSTTTIPTTTTTTAAPTTTTTTTAPATTTSTTTGNLPITVWQIEMRPSSHQPHHAITIFVPTSGNTFTYAGRTYTIKEIKIVRRGARIQATPDLEDGLPGNTQLRFWATDTPGNVQTLRLSDATEQAAGHQWDIIWQRGRHPVDVNRNTTWHIDLTIPAASGS